MMGLFNLPALASRRRNPDRGRDSDGGFTLVELLVVLIILSLIMGLVGPRVLSYLSNARTRSAQLQIPRFPRPSTFSISMSAAIRAPPRGSPA